MKEKRDYDNNVKMEEDTIESHFDFRLNGSIDTDSNSSNYSDNSYSYALFRDELKAQDNCNPDILIEQEGKESNPHKTKYVATELGLNIDEAEIIRTNSTGLTIYNPKNLADRIKGMKNKRVKTKAEKIAERLLYEQQNQSVN